MTEHRRFISLFCTSAAFLVAAGLNGCATPQRQDPPAPIVDARRSPPTPAVEPAVEKEATEEDKQPEPTRVYAYQPVTAGQSEEGVSNPSGAAVGAQDATASDNAADIAESSRQPPNTESAQAQTGQPSGGSVPPREESAQQQAQAETVEQGATTPALPAPETRVASATALHSPQLTPEVDALVRQAESQRQSSDYAGAAATLERALRLQSREGYLWNRLAHVRLEQGLATQAANLAGRANDLSGDSDSLKRDNWRVIADARQRAGDLEGAQEARRRASGG
ncbi:hypothetical protein Thiowin_03133 [Thiorhodovibrio winogradskyi]|uniref:Tetratricopeptide repeat protein n=1 Tax=Thiorhodovibrio winogradskyi TaxID=77007 RepID=A0ABZ0SC94_9GAMM|nr:hypothetical protein [Thiorhodovibrio winogradskyi]